MAEKIKITGSLFINNTSVIYGLTGTGKSTVIVHILSLLKDEIEQAVVFAGNEDCAMTYKEIIPSPLIFLGLKLETLKLIWERQDVLHKTSILANKIEVLQSLFNKLNIRSDELCNLDNSFQKILQQVDAREITRIDSLKKKYNELRIKIYKDHIGQNTDRLSSMELDKQELFALQYHNLNPKMLIIMDDVASNVSSIKTLLEEIFFQGRHRSISLLLSLQDDKKIPPEMRKNAFVNIFTTNICANSLFTKTSNNYGKDVQLRARMAIEDVFNKGNNQYQNLLYIRASDGFYKFTSPATIDKFSFVSDVIRNFCNKIKKNEDEFDNNNPFSKLFSTSF